MAGVARIGGLCLLLLLVGSSCRETGPGQQGASGSRQATTRAAGDTSADGFIDVVVRDHAFVAPERSTSGPVILRMRNDGTVAHQATVLAVGRPGELETFLSALRAGRPLPPSVRAVGQTPVTPPGEESSAPLVLRPGDYLIVCLLRDQQGTSHVVRGMIRPLTVTVP